MNPVLKIIKPGARLRVDHGYVHVLRDGKVVHRQHIDGLLRIEVPADCGPLSELVALAKAGVEVCIHERGTVILRLRPDQAVDRPSLAHRLLVIEDLQWIDDWGERIARHVVSWPVWERFYGALPPPAQRMPALLSAIRQTRWFRFDDRDQRRADAICEQAALKALAEAGLGTGEPTDDPYVRRVCGHLVHAIRPWAWMRMTFCPPNEDGDLHKELHELCVDYVTQLDEELKEIV